MKIKELIGCVADTFFPRHCPMCGAVLNYQERYLCIGCLEKLPVTRMLGKKFNETEQLFAGRVPIERGLSLIYYIKGSESANILHDIKYRNTPDMARWIVGKLSKEAFRGGFFDGIDVVVPVPLYFIKRASRGYNQSEYIARGVSDITGIPVSEKNLVAKKSHSSQTQVSHAERWQNVQGIFNVKRPEEFEGKHLLLVDDVVTTGATMISAAETLKEIPGVRISVLTLAITK